jgi:hypothetical protein
LATLPHDEDADKRSTQHSAYEQIALQRARLIRAHLIRSNLIHARLIRARLIRANLIRARLIRTRLIRTRLVISALDRSLCPRYRFDENENSRARLGCQSSGIVLGVHVVLQQLLQLHGRASLACRLQQTTINHRHNHHHAR